MKRVTSPSTIIVHLRIRRRRCRCLIMPFVLLPIAVWLLDELRTLALTEKAESLCGLRFHGRSLNSDGREWTDGSGYKMTGLASARLRVATRSRIFRGASWSAYTNRSKAAALYWKIL
jgi:hypothetical protein